MNAIHYLQMSFQTKMFPSKRPPMDTSIKYWQIKATVPWHPLWTILQFLIEVASVRFPFHLFSIAALQMTFRFF